MSNQWICQICQLKDEPRYNPFSLWQDSDDDRHNDQIDQLAQGISSILENCKSHSIKMILFQLINLELNQQK